MNVGKSVQEIVANMVLELIPENSRRSWIAMENDGSKEHAKSVAYLHLASFSKTLYPLMIILQQPKGKAGFLESVVGNIVTVRK